MASAAQITANRRNALRSTGPRTAAGKARSCLNARKHGLYARDQSPSAEEAEQIDRLTECYRRRLRPQDAIEEGLIRRLALTQFQLSRISILEAALLNSAIAKARGRYEDLPLAVGQAVIDCCGSLEKLSRYESRLARNLGHTLQTLLARRRRRQAPGEQKSDGTNPIDSVSSGPQPLMKSIACAPQSQQSQGASQGTICRQGKAPLWYTIVLAPPTGKSMTMTSPPRGATDRFCEFLEGFQFDQLPNPVVARAKELTHDGLGALLGATSPRFDIAAVLKRWAAELGGKPEAQIFGTPLQTDCNTAALVNGTLGYYGDIEAHHPGAIMHAIAVVMPAAMAVGERLHSPGRDVLGALVLGTDVCCRVSYALDAPTLYARGFHPTCVAGTFGSMAAAARFEEVACFLGVKGATSKSTRPTRTRNVFDCQRAPSVV